MSALLQEVISHPDWTSGDNIVFIFDDNGSSYNVRRDPHGIYSSSSNTYRPRLVFDCADPTAAPTSNPTLPLPTLAPTPAVPTTLPTGAPTTLPTLAPTGVPTSAPTSAFSISEYMTHCAEEFISDGQVVYDNWGLDYPKPLNYADRTQGAQFETINVPSYCQVSSAYIQFTSYQADSGTVIIRIYATTERNANVLSSSSYSVSSRPRTSAVRGSVFP